MPTFNFELRDFGAALAKEEMRTSDKSRDAAEYLRGAQMNYWRRVFITFVKEDRLNLNR